MFQILRKPHPYIFNAYSVGIPCVITFLIIVVFAPFQFQEFDSGLKLLSGLVISVLVGLGILLSVSGLKRFWPEFMSEERWTVGKEIFLILSVVLVIIVLISAAVLLVTPSGISVWDLLLKTILITLAISSLPILITTLFEQNRHQKAQLKRAQALSESLRDRKEASPAPTPSPEADDSKILIRSENQDIELQLQAPELIYLQSDGNYLDVYYLNGGELQKKVIRNRLKALESQLPAVLFFRCHNRFIVNGQHIIKVEGNARNLMLHLKSVPEGIPVSRTRAREIGPFLEQLP